MERTIKEAEQRIKHHLRDNLILTKQEGEYVEFFLKNAQNSLESASCLFAISTKHNYVPFEDLNGFLWVINASYYSMFYMARALLEHSGIKLKADLSIHLLTFDALIHFLYVNNKLQKKLIDQYKDAQEEAAEILGKEKATTLIQGYHHEKRKRAQFTYETGTHAMENKAKTSLERARQFNTEIKKLIEK
ncbi:MAG: hypothetical protein ACE5FT_03770 [Candidatus Nanoarchaeia archaeon]